MNRTKRCKNTEVDKLFKKATQYRSSWRARCKKACKDLDSIPSRQEIQDWLISKQPFVCYITNQPIRLKDIQADHKNPIARGGSFKLGNIGLTSKRTNKIKGDMTIKEFKSLMKLINNWEDEGKSLFTRLMSSSLIYRKKNVS